MTIDNTLTKDKNHDTTFGFEKKNKFIEVLLSLPSVVLRIYPVSTEYL